MADTQQDAVRGALLFTKTVPLHFCFPSLLCLNYWLLEFCLQVDNSRVAAVRRRHLAPRLGWLEGRDTFVAPRLLPPSTEASTLQQIACAVELPFRELTSWRRLSQLQFRLTQTHYLMRIHGHLASSLALLRVKLPSCNDRPLGRIGSRPLEAAVGLFRHGVFPTWKNSELCRTELLCVCAFLRLSFLRRTSALM